MINNLVLFILPIVPVALADVDASYGAHVAAANNILNNNDGNNVNHRNNYATYHSVKYITVLSISVAKRHLRRDQRESHQAKQSKNKTQGVFSHAAFDFDAPGH